MSTLTDPRAPRPSPTALVLVGGLGTRLRPVLPDTPKAMAPVAGRPFLENICLYLRRFGVSHIVLCVGWGAEQIAYHFRLHPVSGVYLQFSSETQPLGTAGAVKNAEHFIQSDPFLVLNGDSLVGADLREFLDFHERVDAKASMVVVHTPDRHRFGCPVLAADGAITRFSEKSASGPGLVSGGIYLLPREMLAEIPPGVESSIEFSVLPGYAGHGLYGFEAPGPLLDIGTPDAYAKAAAVLTEIDAQWMRG